MAYDVSIDHFDTCLSCYVQDWSGLVFGVPVDKSSRVHHVKAGLLDEIQAYCGDDIPDDAWDAVTATVHEEFRGVHPFKAWDSSLEPAGEHDDECCAWFRVTIESTEK